MFLIHLKKTSRIFRRIRTDRIEHKRNDQLQHHLMHENDGDLFTGNVEQEKRHRYKQLVWKWTHSDPNANCLLGDQSLYGLFLPGVGY